MVLEHQAHMSNLITRANFRTRIMLNRQKELNKGKGKADGFISDYALAEIHRNGDYLLRYLLFSEETVLTEKVSGSAEFIKDFKGNAKLDSKGRSLKDFNLENRIFEFPCSYLIYSDHFNALPKVMIDYIYKKLHNILTSKDNSKDYTHLTPVMRKNILEILVETKKDLPEYWK
jgi:hypothetical protein